MTMLTANTRTVVILDQALDLGGLGNRLAIDLPDALAGPVVVTVRRLSGWAAQTVKVRRVVGTLEVDLGVTLAPPVTPVETARAAFGTARSGERISIGTDAAEAGRVQVRVTAVVAADGLGVRPDEPSGGVSGISDVPGLQAALDAKFGVPARSRAVVLEEDFLTAATAWRDLQGSAISSGSGAAVAAEPNHPGIFSLRDSTTANGGYRVMTYLNSLRIAGGEKATFVFQDRNTTTRATSIFRMGFLDANSITAPTDGVYFEVSGGVAKGVCRSASSGTDTGTTMAVTQNTWYTGVIEVNSDASLVTFTISSEAGTQLWTSTVATNIPTAAGRETGFGVLAAESTTDAAAAICYIDYLALEIGRVLVR